MLWDLGELPFSLRQKVLNFYEFKEKLPNSTDSRVRFFIGRVQVFPRRVASADGRLHIAFKDG